LRAVVITERGGPSVLALREVAEPTAGPFEILVDVAASALNRADLLQRKGVYPAPPGVPADIPGLEFAGTVVAIGAAVTRWSVGDRVMGIVGGGAMAERLVIHEREAMRAPAGLALTEAAAIPEAFGTAFDAAVLQGGLASGQWLAINAVGSGVGTAAIQIARALGARTIGSSRTVTKLGLARGFGLDVAVEGDSAALPDAVSAATAGAGVAVAVDLVGGPGLSAMLECLRPKGTLVLVGLMGGVEAPLSLGRLLRHRLHVVGTVLRSRGLEEKIALARAVEDRLVPLFEGAQPRLRPVVDRVLPWTEVVRAHEALEANDTFGKIVLEHR
jgi:NADPH2:quinone reductase